MVNNGGTVSALSSSGGGSSVKKVGQQSVFSQLSSSQEESRRNSSESWESSVRKALTIWWACLGNQQVVNGSKSKDEINRKELRLSLGGSNTPRSTSLPWSKLKKLLTKGIRGPDVSRWDKNCSKIWAKKQHLSIHRSGMNKFMHTKYSRSNKKLLKSLKTRQTASVSQLTEGNKIPTYILPLKGTLKRAFFVSFVFY